MSGNYFDYYFEIPVNELYEILDMPCMKRVYRD